MTEDQFLGDRAMIEGPAPESHAGIDDHPPEGRAMITAPKIHLGASAPTKLMSSWGAFKMSPKYPLGENGEEKSGPELRS